MNDYETITDIVLSCVPKCGRNEEDFWADYERRCRRLKVIPMEGQVRTALKSLHAEGAIYVKTVQGHKLVCKK